MLLRVGYHNNWKRKEKETRILLEVTIFSQLFAAQCFVDTRFVFRKIEMMMSYP